MYMLKKKSLLIISAVALLGLLLSGCSADTANGKIKYDHVAMPEETDPYYIIVYDIKTPTLIQFNRRRLTCKQGKFFMSRVS